MRHGHPFTGPIGVAGLVGEPEQRNRHRSMNYTGPKVRLSRRLGIALTPKSARIMERRPNPPGQHGAAVRRKKTTTYAMQLLQKQRLRCQFNISERQLRNYYRKAAGKTGNTATHLIEMLETRLDSLVLRAGLARSIYAARQYVRHGHILVDGRRINLPGYQVKPGGRIGVRPRSRKLECFTDALKQSGGTPEYLEVSKSDMSARLIASPMPEDVPIICDLQLVVEYYSR